MGSQPRLDVRTDLPAPAVWRELVRRSAAPAPRLAHEPLYLQGTPGFVDQGTEDAGYRSDWPPAVQAELRIVRAAFVADRWRSAVVEGTQPAKLRVGAWRAVTTDGSEVFVVELLGPPTTWNEYAIITHDAETGEATPAVRSSARWLPCSARHEAPPVQQADLDGDGRWELAFPQFDHNGTVENTDVLLYLRRVPGPRLEPVLRLRSREQIAGWSRADYGFVRRTLLRDGSGLRVRVVFENAVFGLPPLPFGECVLRPRDDGAYEISDLRPWLPRAGSWLSL